MIDGADKGRFVAIKTDRENKMMCGSDSYPSIKDKRMGLIKNYHVSKNPTYIIPVK